VTTIWLAPFYLAKREVHNTYKFFLIQLASKSSVEVMDFEGEFLRWGVLSLYESNNKLINRASLKIHN